MAAYTTSQTGDWGDTATWGGSGPPGNGDTATVNHAVTVSDARIVGTSPAAGTTVLTIGSGITLTISAGASLTVRGDTTCGGIIQNNGTWKFDASLASPTTTNYKCTITGGTSSTTKLSGTGTSSVPAVFTSDSGGGNGYFTATANRGSLDCTWCNFSRLGTAAIPGVALDAGGVNVNWYMTDCNVDACGIFSLVMSAAADTYRQFTRVKFTNGLYTGGAAFGVGMFDSNAGTVGRRTLTNCSFVGRLASGSTSNARDWTVTDCYFGATTNWFQAAGSAATKWVSLTGCFLRIETNTATPTANHDMTDCFILADPGTSWSNIRALYLSSYNNIILDGVVFGFGSNVTGSDSDIIPLPSPGSALSYTVQNCISPGHNDNSAHVGQFISGLGNANVTLTALHNTYVCGDTGGENGGISMGETYAGHANMCGGIKSNNVIGLAAGEGVIYSRRIGAAAATDICASGNVMHNGVHNGMAGNQATGIHDFSTSPNPMFSSGTPNANGLTSDPACVDITRNIASWAVTQGSAGATYADKVTDALSYLAADTTLIASLLAHVRGGFAPTAVAYRNAGHDGVTIGAVEGVWPGGGGGGVGRVTLGHGGSGVMAGGSGQVDLGAFGTTVL